MNSKEIYDLALASYLVVTGHKILSLKPDSHRVIFLFERSDNLEADILSFYNRTAQVDPLSFYEQTKSLKALVRN